MLVSLNGDTDLDAVNDLNAATVINSRNIARMYPPLFINSLARILLVYCVATKKANMSTPSSRGYQERRGRHTFVVALEGVLSPAAQFTTRERFVLRCISHRRHVDELELNGSRRWASRAAR